MVPNNIGCVPNNIDGVPNSVETGYLFHWVPILDSSRSRQLERWPRRRQAGGVCHNHVVHDTAGNAAMGWQDLLWDDRAMASAGPGSRGCYFCFDGHQLRELCLDVCSTAYAAL